MLLTDLLITQTRYAEIEHPGAPRPLESTSTTCRQSPQHESHNNTFCHNELLEKKHPLKVEPDASAELWPTPSPGRWTVPEPRDPLAGPAGDCRTWEGRRELQLCQGLRFITAFVSLSSLTGVPDTCLTGNLGQRGPHGWYPTGGAAGLWPLVAESVGKPRVPSEVQRYSQTRAHPRESDVGNVSEFRSGAP